MTQSYTALLSLLSVGLFLACHPTPTRFELQDPGSTGVHFANRIVENDTFNILAFEYVYNGGGVATGDFNGDGYADLYFTGNTAPNALYLNRADGRVHFTDVTAASGTAGAARWCSGVSTVDVNADGKLDLYVSATVYEPESRRRNLLFVNQGNREVDGLQVPQFAEQAAAYGLADDSHTTHAAFFDYDGDGDLDVYLVTNVMEDRRVPNRYRPKITDGSSARTDKLLRNDFDAGRGHPVFTDVSRAAGIQTEGYGLGVVIEDYNRDGRPDVYVTNDYVTNDLLWINQGDGTFVDEASTYLKHTCYSAMGVEAADLDNDGRPEVVALDMFPEDNLRRKAMMAPMNYTTYLNNDRYGYTYQYARNVLQWHRGPRPDSSGAPIFSEVGMQAGIAGTDWSWSPLAADYDLDGDQDLLITNGFPRDVTDRDFMDYNVNLGALTPPEMLIEQIPTVKLANYAFANTGTAVPHFEQTTADWGMSQPSFSNGAAYADFDRDGDLDYVVNNINDSAFVYVNHSAAAETANWLAVRLEGDAQNPQGLGAQLTLTTASTTQYRYVSPYRGYLSSTGTMAHFGGILGNKKTSLRVTWPDGRVQVLDDLVPGQYLTLRHTDARAETPSPTTSAPPLLAALPSPAAGPHRDSLFIDFNVQRLLPHKLSEYGPGMAVTDLNGDGLDDFYVGGARFFGGRAYLQQADGSFDTRALLPESEAGPEELGILFFDADGDGDDDLYLVSGGSERPVEHPDYRDRLFENVDGQFVRVTDFRLPEAVSGSAVKAADYDRDGDLDLFVAGRIKPAFYPRAVNSYLLRNDSAPGALRFTAVNDALAPQLNGIGLVCDALWTDTDRDGWPDLLLAGEGMPLTVLRNAEGRFEPVADNGLDEQHGWWNSLVGADFDHDGDIDYVAGNLGWNHNFGRAEAGYINVYAADFDGNGGLDAIPAGPAPETRGGPVGEYPLFTRTDLEKQVIKAKATYPEHRTYGRVQLPRLVEDFSTDTPPQRLQANYLSSAYVENRGDGTFRLHPLPAEAQVAPIFGLAVADLNGDQLPDLLLNGNDYGAEITTGRMDALNGLVLLNTGNSDARFRALSIQESGLFQPENGRSLVRLRGANGASLFAFGQNQGQLRLFQHINDTAPVPVPPGVTHALVTLPDGTQYREEFYYGTSFLSQSGRYLWEPGAAYTFYAGERVVE